MSLCRPRAQLQDPSASCGFVVERDAARARVGVSRFQSGLDPHSRLNCYLTARRLSPPTTRTACPIPLYSILILDCAAKWHQLSSTGIALARQQLSSTLARYAELQSPQVTASTPKMYYQSWRGRIYLSRWVSGLGRASMRYSGVPHSFRHYLQFSWK